MGGLKGIEWTDGERAGQKEGIAESYWTPSLGCRSLGRAGGWCSLLGRLKASLSYPRSRNLISGWISETGMQTRNHSWRQRFGSYLHMYTRSEVMRVIEIPQRQAVKCFQHRNLTTVWQPWENAGAQRSTLRVENSLRKNCQSCEILQWGQSR